LNNALTALGLTPQEIQQLDQIASITNDFNPNAFTALAYQLEALAQAPQTTAAANINTQSASGNGNTGAAQTNAASKTRAAGA
jgi:hypothetical protein